MHVCARVFIPQPKLLSPLAVRLLSEELHADRSSERQRQDGVCVSTLPLSLRD